MKYLQLLTILLVVGMACAIPHSAAEGEHAGAPHAASRQGKWGWGWGGYGGYGGWGYGGYGGYYPYYGGWGWGWGR